MLKRPEPEAIKNLCDFLKHLSTLATGSILLLIGFIERVFTTLRFRPLVIISLVAFIVTLMRTARIYRDIVAHQLKDEVEFSKQKDESVYGIDPIFSDWLRIKEQLSKAWSTFVIGLWSLIIFAAINLILK